MPDLRQLRALQAVAATGSFSRAADALHYTQPAVSKTIAALESDVGAVLVERDCRPVRLTDAGAALVRHADEVFARLSSARAEIDAINEVKGGTLAVGTFGSAASAFVVQALCQFRRRYPAVRVSLAEGRPAALVRRLHAGDLDLAAVYDHPTAGEDLSEGLEIHHLLDQPYDIVLPADHAMAARREVRPADLSDEEWLLPDLGHDDPMMALIRRMCAEAGFQPHAPFRVNDCRMTLAMVAAGGGVAVLPRLLAEPPPPGVVLRPVAGQAPTQRVAAARVPTRYLSPAATAFLDIVRQAAAERVRSWAAEPAAA